MDSVYKFLANRDVFRAPISVSSFKNTQELSEISKNIKELTNDEIKVNSKDNELFKNKVYFKDLVSKTYIKIGLSDENLAKLKEHFNNTGFYENKDGSILLSGGAEKFVSSWFADIAYTRGYLNADSDKDGILKPKELASTKSFFAYHINTNALDPTNSVSSANYLSMNTQNLSDEKLEKNLDIENELEAELNRVIKTDKNNDNKITFGEIMDKKDFDFSTTFSVENQINEMKGEIEKNEILKRDLSDEKFEGDTNYDKAQNAFIKAKLQGTDALSADEKELLLSYPQFSSALKDDKELEPIIENISANLENSKIDLKA